MNEVMSAHLELLSYLQIVFSFLYLLYPFLSNWWSLILNKTIQERTSLQCSTRIQINNQWSLTIIKLKLFFIFIESNIYSKIWNKQFNWYLDKLIESSAIFQNKVIWNILLSSYENDNTISLNCILEHSNLRLNWNCQKHFENITH